VLGVGVVVIAAVGCAGYLRRHPPRRLARR